MKIYQNSLIMMMIILLEKLVENRREEFSWLEANWIELTYAVHSFFSYSKELFVFWTIQNVNNNQLLPARSHTKKWIFFQTISSTFEPIVGLVCTTSFIRNWYNMVVFPALSKPTITNLCSILLYRISYDIWNDTQIKKKKKGNEIDGKNKMLKRYKHI